MNDFTCRHQCTFRYFWGISHLIKYKTGNVPKGHSFPPLTRQRGAGIFFWPKPHTVLKTPMSQAQKSPLPFFFSSLFFSFPPPPFPSSPLSLLSPFLFFGSAALVLLNHNPLPIHPVRLELEGVAPLLAGP